MGNSVKSSSNKHEFALFVASLSLLIEKIPVEQEFCISDEYLLHRMKVVLRLSSGDICIFFDQKNHIRCTIKEFLGKKQVRCTLSEKKENRVLLPRITFLLPLLKRDDYEQALYSLTEVGVSNIQLVCTQKSRNSWCDQKDRERAQRIIISAAEQSKNFAYPGLQAPISLLSAIETFDMSDKIEKIFFDSGGISLLSVAQKLFVDNTNHIVLLIGPEGDLSNEEKKVILSKNFIICSLTPTVLRSVQAASLGAGLVRSLLS